jgi:carbamate kinase
MDQKTVVICAGGGGIPTMYEPDGSRRLVGTEVVIDKDFAGALLACELGADMYIMATDTDGVYLDWGKPEARLLRTVTPAELGGFEFPAGSMGPKVAAACEFSSVTGRPAVIGSLTDIGEIVRGRAGTRVEPSVSLAG